MRLKYKRTSYSLTNEELNEMDYEINRIKQNVNNYNIGDIRSSVYNRIGKLDRLNSVSENLETVDKHLKKIDYDYVRQTVRENFN